MKREQTNTGYNVGRRWMIHQENMGNMLKKAPESGEHKKRTERKKSQSSSCSSSRRRRAREEGWELRRTAVDAAVVVVARATRSPSGHLIFPLSADR